MFYALSGPGSYLDPDDAASIKLPWVWRARGGPAYLKEEKIDPLVPCSPLLSLVFAKFFIP